MSLNTILIFLLLVQFFKKAMISKMPPNFCRVQLIIIITLRMPKEIIYVEMNNQYPFAEITQKNDGSKTILIKQTLQCDSQPRFIIKEKIRMLKSLAFQHLIGLQSTKSEESNIILIFQHVPFHFPEDFHKMSEEKMQRLKEELGNLCQDFASKGIIHQLDPKRIGLDKRYGLKYFLGVDFKMDKTANKQKILDQYQKVINQSIFNNLPNHLVKKRPPHKDQQKDVSSKQSELQIDVRNLLAYESPPQRRIMKKSSILQFQCETSQPISNQKQLKASNRFTFNHNKQIHLPINQKDQDGENKSNRKFKMQDLAARIKTLKGYMKQLSMKATPKSNHISKTIKTDPSESSNDCSQIKQASLPPHFSKFQMKLNEFRESKLRKSSHQPDIFSQKASERTLLVPRTHPSKSFQQPQPSKNQSKCDKQCTIRETLLENIAVVNPIMTCPSSFTKKNSINYCKNDRQLQQYMTLANKDQYCAQFFLLLDDRQVSNQHSQRTVKKASQNDKPSVALKPQKEAECKISKQRENLKTQSSENTLQIQSRVEKVIRSSLKLINGLRSRESVRCG